jgi:hypothetical protein
MIEILDDSLLKMHHEMVVMKPASGSRVTLIGRKLYNTLLAVAQQEMAGVAPLATHTFEAPLNSLLKTSGAHEDRTVAKKYLQEMQDLKVTWESTAPGDGVKWMGLHMLSQVKILVRNGQTWISWAFPPEVMEMVLNPTRYAVWNLRVTASMGTYVSLALYIICARYRDNPSGVTSRKSPDWWIDALSSVGSTPDKKRREWRKFKAEKLNDAIDDINKNTDIEVELLELKKGRAVTEVQFTVRKKQQASSSLQKQVVNAELITHLIRAGISEQRAETLIREYGEDLVKAKLEELKKRTTNKSLSPVDNYFAYLRTLLRNATLGVTQAGATVQTHVPLAKAETAKITSSEPEQQALKSNSESDRIRSTLLEINALESSVRQYWVDQAVAELKAKKMFSSIDKKRAAEGRVVMGVLGSKVVAIYTEQTYGVVQGSSDFSSLPS